MSDRKRLGLWFAAGIDNALAARAALSELQGRHPGADWVLFGPGESLFLFEMDDRVPVYIPLRALEARRPAQSRLSYYLEKRAQFKKLQSLRLDSCFGVALLHADPRINTQVANTFADTLGELGVSGELMHKEKSAFSAMQRPELQAGPQSLAFATRLYRKVPPNQSKQLLLLAHIGAQDEPIDTQWQQVHQVFQADSAGFATTVHALTAVITNGDRLVARQLAQTHPDWVQVNVAQTMGLIAYADRVICCSETITRICIEMNRSDRLLLGKSYS